MEDVCRKTGVTDQQLDQEIPNSDIYCVAEHIKDIYCVAEHIEMTPGLLERLELTTAEKAMLLERESTKAIKQEWVMH